MSAAAIRVEITGALRDAIEEAIATGEYLSPDEVVRDALQGWQDSRGPTGEAVTELRRLWDEGIASGPARHVDIEGVKGEARERLRDSQGS